MFALALAFALALLALLLLRTPTPPTHPATPPPRHVSFSDSPPSTRRRWSVPFPRRTPASPLGRFASDATKSPAISRRLSLPTRWRSSKSHPRAPSAPSPPRTKFVNPFNRSRALSPPMSIKSPDTPPSAPSSPSPRSTARRTLVNKFKSIFKSAPPQSSPIIQSSTIVNTISAKFRRKPPPRTQPYGPPWNAPMPAPGFSISQHSLPNVAHGPLSRKNYKSSTHHSSTPHRASTLPAQISPRTFITELDEKLLLLQQQRIHDIVSSPHA